MYLRAIVLADRSGAELALGIPKGKVALALPIQMLSAVANALRPGDRVVARGGSWHDRPVTATASVRQAYERWQKVFNVGFRVVCEDE